VTEKIDELPSRIVLNLCGKEHTSAMQTVFAAEEVIGRRAIFEHREQRYGQTYHENISIENAKKFIGWEPKTKFKDGMAYTYSTDPRFK
jgi:nucleoside-diphosphate-sugar epimerase